MRLDNPDGAKSKLIYAGFPNIAILSKSAMPDEIQVTFCHTTIGNKYPRETITAFALK